MRWTSIPSVGGWGGDGVSWDTPSYTTETGLSANLKRPLGSYADFHFEVAFCLGLSLERMLVQNIAHVRKWLDFQENERTGDMHFYTNNFAQRLVLSQRQKSTIIHPWAGSESLWFHTWIGNTDACVRRLRREGQSTRHPFPDRKVERDNPASS